MTRDHNEELLEEKLIVENALNLWMACLIFEPHLFDEFRAGSNFGPSIDSADDFILVGLLTCPIEKVRSSFRHVLYSLAKRLDSE